MSHRSLHVQLVCAAMVAVVAGCAGPTILFERAPMRMPVVERLSASSVQIDWPASFSDGSVAIFAGTSPDSIDRARPLAVASGDSANLTGKQDSRISRARRLYYELVPTPGGEAVIVAERRLPLDCCNNFRDLGGYRSADGRTVRWNRVYRANELSKLDAHDLAYLSHLDIKLVCDFRSNRERSSKPDRKIHPATEQLSLPVDQEGVDPVEVQQKIRTGGMLALGVEEQMNDAYRAFVTEYSDTWAQMFERLAEPGNLPAVVHCTAGKDRTGFASALVLLALDVPVDTVFEDYLLTNYYQQNFFRFVLRWVPLYSFFRTNPADLLPLLTARRAYLQTAIEAMVDGYGSIDAYLEQALGLDAAKRAHLATLLLK